MHSLTAWFFAAFVIMHVYPTTTGHTPKVQLGIPDAPVGGGYG